MTITVEQADSYHDLRGNSDWLSLDTDQKTAAIANADDYVTAYYLPLKSDVEDDNPRLIAAYSLLALEFSSNPQTLKTDQLLKSKEVTSGEDSSKVMYQDADKAPITDPYPLVTAIIAPLRVNQTNHGISFGQMI